MIRRIMPRSGGLIGMAEATLAVLIFGPVAITYFMKSNAALSFLALCAGFVLSTSVIGDLKHLLSQTNLSVTNDTVGAILIAAPFLITMLATRHGHARGPLEIGQLLAALAGGGLLALALGPTLANSGQFSIMTASSWHALSKIQADVIGFGGLLSLLLVWFGNFRRHSKKH